MRTQLLTLIFLLVFFFPVFGQQVELTPADYRRAEYFLRDAFREKTFNVQVTPNWFPDSTGFWYEVLGRGQRAFQQVDFRELEIREALDRERLAALLNREFDLEVNADSLPLTRVAFTGKDTLTFGIGDTRYAVDLRSWAASVIQRPRQPERDPFTSTSPDGRWVAFSKDYNLFIRSTETGEEIQLSTAGRRHYEYATYYGWGDIIEGEDGERPPRFSVRWSPDSRMLLTNIADFSVAEKMYLLDWSVDTLFRPRLLGYYRGSPGDSTMVYIKPVLFEVATRREIAVDIPPKVHILSPNLQWMPDGQSLVGTYYERGYKTLHYVEVNAADGSVRRVFTESSPTSVNNAFYEFRVLADQRRILFTSEMSGWNHLYLLDLDRGEYRQLTGGDYIVNGVERVDAAHGWIYFTAMGKEPARNIYWQHLYRVDLEGAQVELLTPETAHHLIDWSPGGDYFVDNYSTATHPTTTVLRRTQNPDFRLELSRADASGLFATGWQTPELVVVKAADGESDIYCAIWKPTNFDPDRMYPVIDYSYTGPFTFRHPRSFRNALAGTDQALAELGFVVVHIDGRGSAGRSKAFRDHSYKRLGYGLVDHVHAIRELGKRLPWVDTTRVGIFGHSAGGYDAARGMLLFPEFYKAAVASSGDHDHRMEKAWWPEMYMGWPVDSAYHQQSNVTMAGNLRGKLLLVHGGLDENVNPSATFKLSEALIRADKDFDLLIIPSQRHGYGGAYGDYFTKKRWNYFVEHLLGATPIWNYQEE